MLVTLFEHISYDYILDQRFAKIVLNQCQSVPVQFGQILSVSLRYVLGSNSQAGEFASE